MHKFTKVLLLLSVLISVKAIAQNPNAAYQPPEFRDAERIKKIEMIFPVIEKMYKEYAEKNHFPGYSFGIMVDGKLVISGVTKRPFC